MKTFRISVMTPVEVVVDQDARSVRVPTESGLVGLRPGSEPTAMAFEAGLVLVHRPEAILLLATAGGLLRYDGRHLQLLTPIAVSGTAAKTLTDELRAAMSVPGSEWDARTRLGRLETQILRELPSLGRQSTGADRGMP